MRSYLKIWEFAVRAVRLSSWATTLAMIVALGFLLVCPVLELVIVKRITEFFVSREEGGIGLPDINIVFMTEIFSLYLLVQVIYFFTRIKRVQLIDAIAGSIPERENRLAGGWIRLIFLETTTQAIAFAQLVAITCFVFYTSIIFGAFFVVAIMVNAAIIIWLFSGEVAAQAGMRSPGKEFMHKIAGMRMLSRTRATEKGVLSCGILSAGLMLSFILAVSLGVVGVVQGVVMIFAIRFYSSIMSLFSGSMMRLARAFAFAEGVFSSITAKGKHTPTTSRGAGINSELMDDF